MHPREPVPEDRNRPVNLAFTRHKASQPAKETSSTACIQTASLMHSEPQTRSQLPANRPQASAATPAKKPHIRMTPRCKPLLATPWDRLAEPEHASREGFRVSPHHLLLLESIFWLLPPPTGMTSHSTGLPPALSRDPHRKRASFGMRVC